MGARHTIQHAFPTRKGNARQTLPPPLDAPPFPHRSLFMRLSLFLALWLPVALGAQVRPVQKKPPTPTKPPVASPITPATTPVIAVPYARIAGEVYDSIAGAPLQQATVQFVAANDPAQVRSVRTDSLGAFVLDSMRIGTYLVGMIHEQVDRLGLESRVVQVNIVSSGDVTLSLGIPSPATMLANACGVSGSAAGSEQTRGAFMGLVRTARGAPLEGPARVRVQYNETTVTATGVQRRFPSRFADASPSGAFVLCGVPPDAPVTTRAFAGPDSSGVVELKVPRHGLLVRDMLIGNPVRITKAPSGPTERPQLLLQGAGRLKGVVRDTAGKPLVGARVSVPGTGTEGTTTGGGQFTLDSLPGGTWMVEARAVGFQPTRAVVDLRDETEALTELALEGLVPRVDTVKVQADRWSREMAGFESRRKMGGGYYMDDEQLTRRNAQFMSDIMRGTPGVSVIPGQSGGRDRIAMRGGAGSGTCTPAVFINGMNTPIPDGILENVVNSADVRAVEVYTRTGSTPVEYQARNGCGSIVIWTGARRR